jgi:hypothetical protein
MPISTKISTLWVVVLFNMAFADILSFMLPEFAVQIQSGEVDGVVITPMFMLVAAVLIEISIVMIYLSRALNRRASRVANIGAVGVTALFVIGGGSWVPHYVFFASVEVIIMIYIAYLAWTWRG